jgi:hypothetical protein
MNETVSFEAIPVNLLPLLQAQYPSFRDWYLAREAAKLRLETAALEVFPAPDQAYEAARYLRSRIMRWDREHPVPLTAQDVEKVAGETKPRLRLG